MSEFDWLSLKHPWERLRWARLYWQNKKGAATSAKAAAESLGMQENTYTAYERPPGDGTKKHTPLSHQRAIQFGRKFGVNWVWILEGEETPFERTPAQERAIRLMAEAPEDEQERIADIIAAALRKAS